MSHELQSHTYHLLRILQILRAVLKYSRNNSRNSVSMQECTLACSGMSCFRFQAVGVERRQSDPPRNVQTQAANNFPLGAQYDSIPGTRSADDLHGVGN